MAKINFEDLKNILTITPPKISVGIYGFHGCGKTQCSMQVAKLLGYDQICFLDMGIMDANDIVGNPLTSSRKKIRIKIVDGVPIVGKDGKFLTEEYESPVTLYAEPYWWPEDETKPVFLIVDEANRLANRSVQNSMMRLINEKIVGNRKLHPDSRILATFNPTGFDQYHVQEWDTAYSSRFVTYEFMPSSNEWLAIGNARGFHPEIMRYIANYPDELLPWSNDEEMNSIKENQQTKNARAWEKLSDMMCDPNWGDIYGKKLSKFKTVAAGVVGQAGAEKFVTYLGTQNRIDIKDLLGNFAKYKTQINEMTNFDQAMVVRDVVEFLKHSREDIATLKSFEKGLLAFMEKGVRAENATVGYKLIFSSLSTWGASVYRAMPSLLQLRSQAFTV